MHKYLIYTFNTLQNSIYFYIITGPITRRNIHLDLKKNADQIPIIGSTGESTLLDVYGVSYGTYDDNILLYRTNENGGNFNIDLPTVKTSDVVKPICQSYKFLPKK